MSAAWRRKEVIGDCTLYLGDSCAILPTLGKLHAVVTDPPYGIGAAKAKAHSRVRDRNVWAGKNWDNTAPSSAFMQTIIDKSEHAIIWGGNYFSLPPATCWLVWDKLNAPGFSLADAELAWTNIGGAVRKWSGRAPLQGVHTKLHPTQKPDGLMSWCLNFIKNEGEICDPFMGAGTTGVACVKAGLPFIGIELDDEYFDGACQRIRTAYSTPDMFIEAVRALKQEDLL